jgi:glutathione-specific gamma-glutamylcyclotransferase
MLTHMSDLWVFGYGSLMWRPGFDFLEQRPARLFGWHRALCVYSWHHRGTEAHPGLVLGLDRGGSCQGVAYRVAEAKAAAVVDYLREREQVTRVYIEAYRPIHLANPESTAEALVYLIDRTHPQYAGALPKETQLRFVANSEGASGHNRDYVLSTADQLERLGIYDENFVWLAAELRAVKPSAPVSGGDALALDRGDVGHDPAAGAGRSGEEMNEGPEARTPRKLPK